MTQEAREAAGPSTSPTCQHKEIGTGPKSTPADAGSSDSLVTCGQKLHDRDTKGPPSPGWPLGCSSCCPLWKGAANLEFKAPQ